ncbi:efflux RND transporter periplasmic adaptor subunit [Methylocaldum gracile]|uniref:efflux RND transporter periplasmic adaptor subunit n=1 Tax=Methylocaldum sp. 0917 TaxID=2485163 RepID=UPI0010F42EC0
MKPTLCPPVMAVLLSAVLVFPAFSDDDDPDAKARSDRPASIQKSEPESRRAAAVRMTAEQQKASGLTVEVLNALTFHPEIMAYGKVVDIQPLLALHVRYQTAGTEAEIANAAVELAQKNRNRLTTLHREDIVASRDLAQAEAQYQADRAKLEAARRLMREIRHEARQAWGDELTRIAFDGESRLFQDFLSRSRVLLLIALPSGQSLPPDKRSLFVARENDRSAAHRAELISPAPKTDDLVQGETYFFHAPSDRLRAGMRVNAWLPASGEPLTGVAIPPSAIVWHAGKPWAYRQSDDRTFIRTEITVYREHTDFWFVDHGFAAGDKIVVTGGQLLLSEEFRGNIPDEDDD